MDYQNNIVIKEEPIEYEDEKIKLLDLNISVKVENCSTPDEVWYARNEALFEDIRKKLNDAEINNQCPHCGQRFAERYSLFIHNMQHLRVIIKTKIFQCDICSRYFTTLHNLRKHMSTHNNATKQQTIKAKGKLKTKMKHECNICRMILSYKAWHEHMRWVHAKERYKCSKCFKEFKTPKNLRRHKMYTHNGVVANHYKDHKKVLPIENVPCNECNKVFSNKHSLKTHKRNCHSKAHQCFICKSVLKSKSYLMTHMRRVHDHSGNVHACEICGKKFKSLRYVKIHIKNSHVKGKNKIIKRESSLFDIEK